MLLDGLGWSRYSVFAPCIMTQTRVLRRSGGGCPKTRWNTNRLIEAGFSSLMPVIAIYFTFFVFQLFCLYLT